MRFGVGPHHPCRSGSPDPDLFGIGRSRTTDVGPMPSGIRHPSFFPQRAGPSGTRQKNRHAGAGIREITFVTFPLRKHLVQTRTRLAPSSVWMRTRCRFGSHRRFVCRRDLLIWLPAIGRLPQTLQTRDMIMPPLFFSLILNQAIG